MLRCDWLPSECRIVKQRVTFSSDIDRQDTAQTRLPSHRPPHSIGSLFRYPEKHTCIPFITWKLPVDRTNFKFSVDWTLADYSNIRRIIILNAKHIYFNMFLDKCGIQTPMPEPKFRCIRFMLLNCYNAFLTLSLFQWFVFEKSLNQIWLLHKGIFAKDDKLWRS